MPIPTGALRTGSVLISSQPTADANDTYLQTEILKVRPQAQVQKITAGATVTIARDFNDITDDDHVAGPYKLTRSPKWITIDTAEINEQGQFVHKLTTTAGKTTPTGRVLRVSTAYLAPIGTWTLEAYYQII